MIGVEPWWTLAQALRPITVATVKTENWQKILRDALTSFTIGPPVHGVPLPTLLGP